MTEDTYNKIAAILALFVPEKERVEAIIDLIESELNITKPDYTVKELIHLFNLNKDTLYTHAKEFPGYYQIGKEIRFVRDEIDKARRSRQNLLPQPLKKNSLLWAKKELA